MYEPKDLPPPLPITPTVPSPRTADPPLDISPPSPHPSPPFTRSPIGISSASELPSPFELTPAAPVTPVSTTSASSLEVVQKRADEALVALQEARARLRKLKETVGMTEEAITAAHNASVQAFRRRGLALTRLGEAKAKKAGPLPAARSPLPPSTSSVTVPLPTAAAVSTAPTLIGVPYYYYYPYPTYAMYPPTLYNNGYR